MFARQILLAALVLLPTSPYSRAIAKGQDIKLSLICELENNVVEFVVVADFKTDGELYDAATYTSGGVTKVYYLSQKKIGADELYNFILNEKNPRASVQLRVYKAKGETLPALATLLGVRPKPVDVPGFCVMV